MKRFWRSAALAAVAGIGIVPLAASSAGAVLAPPATVAAYDSMPTPQPGNVDSEAFEATQTKQLGDKITLAGNGSNLKTVDVLMSSWGCESGGGATCVTTPG